MKMCLLVYKYISLQMTIDRLPTDKPLYSFLLLYPQQTSATTICLITFCVSRRRCKMYCGHARLCVCLSTAVCPHYCTDPDVTWRHGRGCPLVVHYWADLQSRHGFCCYGNMTRTLVTSLRPSSDMTT